MYMPGIDRAEAIRLVNEIALSDVWVALTGSISKKEIIMHSDLSPERSNALIISYIVSNGKLRKKLLEILKTNDLL